MQDVQAELDVQKQKRQVELNENNDIRKQIQGAIDDYKKKEEGYRSQMEKHGQSISVIEKKLKDTIEGTVTKTLREAETEKAKFMAACQNVNDLNGKINEFLKKFDNIKEEMNDNAKKFESYSQEVETKKLEIKTLEVEIESLRITEKHHTKVKAEITEERQRLTKQVETLKSLSGALQLQLKSLQAI